ncbi:MAG: amidohydrolase family protein [Myxococcota bacterium]
MTTTLRSERVLWPDGRIAPGVLTIDGPTIAALDAPRRGREVDVDYGSRFVTPALVDAHTHLALVALRGWDPGAAAGTNVVEDLFFGFEAQLTAADVRALTRIGAYECLLQGIGFVWEHYYEAEAVAAGLRDVGLAGVVAPTLQDLGGPGRDAPDAALQAAVDLTDARWSASGIYAAVGPHATDTVSGELFRRAVAVARRHDLPLHLHLAQSPEERDRIAHREGMTPVAWLDRLGVLDAAPLVLAHAIFVPERDLRRLAEVDATLVYCPYAAYLFGFPASFAAWEDAGVDWALATDAPCSNDTINLQLELRALAAGRALRATHHPAYARYLAGGAGHEAAAAWHVRQHHHQRTPEPAAVWSRVCAVPGRIHPAVTVGTLAPGALANLAVWDLDHPALWPAHEPLRTLCAADATKGLYAMWTLGQRRGEDGRLAASLVGSDDYREARREANARLAHLIAGLRRPSR